MDTLKQCETYCTNLLPIIDDVWLQDLGTGVVVYTSSIGCVTDPDVVPPTSGDNFVLVCPSGDLILAPHVVPYNLDIFSDNQWCNRHHLLEYW